MDGTDLFDGLDLSGADRGVLALALAIALLRLIKVVLDRYVTRAPAPPPPPSVAEAEASDRQRLMAAQVSELHSWHQTDSSGRQVWRSPEVLEGIRLLRDEGRETRLRLEEVYRILQSVDRRTRAPAQTVGQPACTDRPTEG